MTTKTETLAAKLDAARKAHRKTRTAATQSVLDQAAADYRAADSAANLARVTANTRGPYSINV